MMSFIVIYPANHKYIYYKMFKLVLQSIQQRAIIRLMVQLDGGEDKRKHLGMVQGVINRMASNSFLFKGWSITLIAAISAFAAKDSNPALMTIPVVTTLLFWAIDSYYLMLERAFIEIYKIVAAKPANQIDFNMTPAREDKTFHVWLSTLKRPILILFYGVVLIMLIVLICILNSVKVKVEVEYGA